MPKKIKLFALSTCIHCRHTKEFLDESNIGYECVYVDKLEGEERQKAMVEVMLYNPAVTFPTLLIGDNVVVGFRKDKIKEFLKK